MLVYAWYVCRPLRRVVDPPRSTHSPVDLAPAQPTFRVPPLLAPEVGPLVPETDPLFGVLVVVVEVFPLRWPRLAYDPHARRASIEAPVYEAPVGFLRQAPIDRVHDRCAHRAVALIGSGEQLVELFEVVMGGTGHCGTLAPWAPARNVAEDLVNPSGEPDGPSWSCLVTRLDALLL